MTHLAILGAGQLGSYLCHAARHLGIETTVLAQDPNETAVSAADHVIYGELELGEPLQNLIRDCDVVTFEKEDIPIDVLEHLAKEADSGQLTIAPSVDTMLLLQNKAKQKRWLESHGFPTAPFIVADTGPSVTQMQNQLGTPFVLKTQRGGYDGLGVKIVRSPADAEPFANIPTIAEVFIDQKRELAVLVARNVKGETAVYPCMEMFFESKGNVLRHVVCPASISEQVNSSATELATNIVEALNGVGIFAVELFVQEDQLWVNEISPRVHNTGHLTIEAQPTSQFEQHVRAVCGLPFGPISPHNAGAMINLLCEPELETACREGTGISNPAADTYVHWYNKKALRPMRKMGHITATATNATDALRIATSHLHHLVN